MIIQPTILNTGVQPENTHKVTFIDYDGTVLKTQYCRAGQSAIAPAIPEIENLTFQAWNNSLVNITTDAVIGAIRKTTDNKTYIYLTLNAVTGLSVPICLYKAGTSLMTINWGDGTIDYTTNTQGNITVPAHVYSVGGDKIISITCNENYQLGHGTDLTRLLGTSNNTITSVLLSSYVNSISAYGFNSCTNLTRINITTSVTSINEYSFQGCVNLRGVIIPNSIGIIYKYSFHNCFNLKLVSIPSTIDKLYQYSFSGCNNLSTIAINVANQIENNVFLNCKSLSISNLILNTYSIGNYAFENSSINSVVLKNITMLSVGLFRNASSLKNVTINGSVTWVRSECFRWCYGLSSLDFPSSLNGSSTGIETLAFDQCLNVVDYYFRGLTPPPLAVNSFTGINPMCKIHVPASAVNAYKTTTNWVNVANYIIGDL